MNNSSDPAPHTTPRSKRPLWVRLFRWSLVLLAVLVTVVLCIYPVAIGYYATLSTARAVGDPPAGFARLSLTTAEGDTLAAWYLPPRNGAVIILLHGATGSRDDLRAPAALLAENRYGVLALDLRGHGESEGRANLFGWQGTSDVRAAVDYLLTQPDVITVGAWGFSLGAEVLMGAAASAPEIKAIVADGATHRTYFDSREAPIGRMAPGETMVWLMYATVQVITGQPPPPPLVDSLAASGDTRFLLIAAENTPHEIDYNTRYLQVLGKRGALWVAPRVGHVGAFWNLRDDYTQRVLDLYGDTLW